MQYVFENWLLNLLRWTISQGCIYRIIREYFLVQSTPWGQVLLPVDIEEVKEDEQGVPAFQMAMFRHDESTTEHEQSMIPHLKPFRETNQVRTSGCGILGDVV